MVNTNKLKGKIVENGFSISSYANVLGINRNALSAKLNNKSPFDIEQVKIMQQTLNINDIEEYFFVG